MSATWQVVFYLLGIVCFLAGAWGVTTIRRPVALGWLGAAFVTLIPLVAAWQAL